MEQVQAFRAMDGTLFDMPQDALRHDVENQAYELLRRAAGRPEDAGDSRYVAHIVVTDIAAHSPEILPRLVAALLLK